MKHIDAADVVQSVCTIYIYCALSSVCALDGCQTIAGFTPDARVFTVERCQHRRLRVGGAVRRTRFGPIRQRTAGRKSM